MKLRRKSLAVAFNPLVVDLSHHNDVADFGAVKAAGVGGFIHGATKGVGFASRCLFSPDADVISAQVPHTRKLATRRQCITLG